MAKKTKIKLLIFLGLDALLVAICFLEIAKPSIHFAGSWLLNPQGVIAQKERALIITSTLIMLIVVVPVYFLLFFIISKYRADKIAAKYTPNSTSSPAAALGLWAIPIIIIFIIGVLNWQSTHALDPYNAIASNKKPITIEVIALQWKFLFIYPEQNIATVNFIEFPVNTPVNFQLTADAPMSSFWIPQLGSQIYAMAAMSTRLNLMANSIGDFAGKNTEINGAGFSGMKFIARSASQADFEAWIKSVKSSQNTLSLEEYNKLAAPSENNSSVVYSSVEKNLYNSVIMKFMEPASPGASQGGPSSEEHNTATSSMMAMPAMDMK